MKNLASKIARLEAARPLATLEDDLIGDWPKEELLGLLRGWGIGIRQVETVIDEVCEHIAASQDPNPGVKMFADWRELVAADLRAALTRARAELLAARRKARL